MSLQQQELNSVIPDLRDLSLERLAELGDSVLAHRSPCTVSGSRKPACR